MGKRKQTTAEDHDSDSDVSQIDVDFDFFDPNPKIDYHALLRLLRQLFQGDGELLQLPDLVDLILSQPLVGTTVKTDGMDSDPLAALTVLNMSVHQNHPAIKALLSYLLQKLKDPALRALFTPTHNSSHQIGFVLSERLINMPVQVVPHMYRMLRSEVAWALEDKEPYNFTHLLFISRTYRLTAEDEAAMQAAQRSAKRQKPSTSSESTEGTGGGGVYSFHPEDEVIQKLSTYTLDYPYTTTPPEPREQDAFGLETAGRLMLVPMERFEELVKMLEETYDQAPGAGASR